MNVPSELWQQLFSWSDIRIALGRLAELASWHEVLFPVVSPSRSRSTLARWCGNAVHRDSCLQKCWPHLCRKQCKPRPKRHGNFLLSVWSLMTAYVFPVQNLYYPPDPVLHTKENSEKWEHSVWVAHSPCLQGEKEVKKEDASTSPALSVWRLSCWNRESVFCI